MGLLRSYPYYGEKSKRQDRLQFLVALVVVVLALMIDATHCAKTKTKPHIIIIVADDLGYNDVSFHGSNQIPTPNIDFLAYNGVILNNYYVQPICTPTRAALLTGRHPIHTGMQHNVIVGSQPYGLPLNETLMSQHLNRLGYRSHIVGKWHLGMFSWEYTPLYRGFESHLGYYQGCEDYYEHTYEANLDQWGLDFRSGKTLLRNMTGKYSTDIFRDEAVNVINRHNTSEPLFLYLPFQSVHSGNKNGAHLQAPDKYIKKFHYIQNLERRKYAAMLGAMDDAIGTIYDTLTHRGMLENSIIIFTTDNGGPANGFDVNAANNFPLRGLKATLWEGGVRAVGLVHSPLLKVKGYVADQMLHVCDWLPTLYSAAGGNVSQLQNLDGFDAWEMLNTNGANVRDEILHNIDPGNPGDPVGEESESETENKIAAYSIRVGEYKLIRGSGISTSYPYWYPPWQVTDDSSLLHYEKFNNFNNVSSFPGQPRQQFDQKYKDEVDGGGGNTNTFKVKGEEEEKEELYKSLWPLDVYQRLDYLYNSNNNNNNNDNYNNNDDDNNDNVVKLNEFVDLKFKPESGSGSTNTNSKIQSPNKMLKLKHKQEGKSTTGGRGNDQGQGGHYGKGKANPVKIDCGVKPANASSNCRPETSVCLFHIPTDPCEYNNIAAQNPHIVAALMKRLHAWYKTMVPAGNKPFDPAGNPRLHQGAWEPWQ